VASGGAVNNPQGCFLPNPLIIQAQTKMTPKKEVIFIGGEWGIRTYGCICLYIHRFNAYRPKYVIRNVIRKFPFLGLLGLYLLRRLSTQQASC